MSQETRDIILRLGRKFLWLILILVGLNILYRICWYGRDLKENCSLIQLSRKPVHEHADIIYLAESSNHSYDVHDTDTSHISQMLGRHFPNHRISSLTKDACHAGIYYDVLRNIPKKNDIQTVIVTVNLRSFSSEWIYSDLEVPLQKEQVFMKKAPALFKRMLIAFKAYNHWTENEREEIVRDGIKRQKLDFPYYFPYKNAAAWDKAIGSQDHLYNGQQVSMDTIVLTCHYIKSFAYQMSEDNPRVKDFDKIVKLCKRRGWRLVLHILPDNIDQIQALAGPDLVFLMKQNANYIVKRYGPQGVTVVNNQNIVRDRSFRDRDFPTEHYNQVGRQAIADAIAEQLEELDKAPSGKNNHRNN
ncbi:MAG: hypothetical protein MJZ87_03770 [Bacteroidales bacterium]|nr:hypothetical protein [Bacteroidales bacterium]